MLWISKAKDDDIVSWQKNKLKIKKIGGSTKNENKYKKINFKCNTFSDGIINTSNHTSYRITNEARCTTSNVICNIGFK